MMLDVVLTLLLKEIETDRNLPTECSSHTYFNV